MRHNSYMHLQGHEVTPSFDFRSGIILFPAATKFQSWVQTNTQSGETHDTNDPNYTKYNQVSKINFDWGNGTCGKVKKVVTILQKLYSTCIYNKPAVKKYNIFNSNNN
jgi:hypothetical protein